MCLRKHIALRHQWPLGLGKFENKLWVANCFFGKIVLSTFARFNFEKITDSAIANQLKSLGRSFFYCKIDTRKCSYPELF